jgi:hypothetical protein
LKAIEQRVIVNVKRAAAGREVEGTPLIIHFRGQPKNVWAPAFFPLFAVKSPCHLDPTRRSICCGLAIVSHTVIFHSIHATHRTLYELNVSQVKLSRHRRKISPVSSAQNPPLYVKTPHSSLSWRFAPLLINQFLHATITIEAFTSRILRAS